MSRARKSAARSPKMTPEATRIMMNDLESW